MIFTLNEEVHLPACLASLKWCDDIIVIDSFSTDRSLEICRNFGARIYQRAFDGFGSQRNWALANTSPKHDWILILDADERVPESLAVELRDAILAAPKDVAAFRLTRRFYFWGRWLKYSSLYPTYVVRVVRSRRVTYVNRGHAETQVVDGRTAQLEGYLLDENIKGMDEWFARQNRYSTREAEYELDREQEPWRFSEMLGPDPLARRALLKRVAASIPGRPFWYFLYSYLLRGGFRDGRDGLVFCLMKSLYEAMISIKKYDLKRSRLRR